jgi:transcriptional regulator with XRE-family HTH domain
MVSREKRLHEVFEHLRKFFGIHTQTDFAVALKYSRVYISSALNGNEKNLTDKLFENICEAYPGVFSLHYLLTGEGDLLTLEEEVHSEEFEKQAASVKSSAPDSTTEQTYIMSKMFETLLKPIESAHAETVAALNQQIAEKQSRIDDLERTVADKDEIIRTRDARILELERRIAQFNADDLSKYPYTIGVAEDHSRPQQTK